MIDTTRTLQYKTSSGRWIDCGDRSNEFLSTAEKFISCHQNKMLLLGVYLTISERLDAGKTLHYGSDWYEEIRYEPCSISDIQADMVKCECGHSVPRASVMNASMGTSCPNCYDKMSA